MRHIERWQQLITGRVGVASDRSALGANAHGMGAQIDLGCCR